GMLVVYSDGLVERRDEDVDRGLARLVALSGGQLGATELCTRLIEECRDPKEDDDATMLVLRRDR
ncbi:SpoIIE family protein phosphatase, partial [Nocardioides sp. MAHUQ-72]|uniref:SpoIIE family protein phosphatase n=1 Tax=unclassified Nocardioides TaxID=2615069 RepID=UPI003614173F